MQEEVEAAELRTNLFDFCYVLLHLLYCRFCRGLLVAVYATYPVARAAMTCDQEYVLNGSITTVNRGSTGCMTNTS